MGRLYQLMSEQGQFWKESWDVKASSARTPLWGDWDVIYKNPRPSLDQTLVSLPAPELPLLTLDSDWEAGNATRVKMAGEFLAQNDELLDLIYANESRVQFHRYNLQIYLSIAQLFRQNLLMLAAMQQITSQMKLAAEYARRANSAAAVAALDQALNLAADIRNRRNEALQTAMDTWYQQWFPRAPEANGRRFLDQVDDVKDHLPVRTVDLSYLIYRELLYPFDDWAERTVSARNQYAEAHHLPAKSFSLERKNTAREGAQ